MYKRESSDGSTAERRGRGAFERHRSSKKAQTKEEKPSESIGRSADISAGGAYYPETLPGSYDDISAYGAAPTDSRFSQHFGNPEAEHRQMSLYDNSPPEYRPPMPCGSSPEPRRRPQHAPAEPRLPVPPARPAQPVQPTQPTPSASAANGAEPISRMSRGTIMASQNSIFWPMLCWVIAVAVVAVILPRTSVFSRVIRIEEQPSAADIVVQAQPDMFIASGDEGAVVTVLQKALHQLGYLEFDDISGIYDAKTSEAVNLALATQGIAGSEGCSEENHSCILEMAQNAAGGTSEDSQP